MSLNIGWDAVALTLILRVWLRIARFTPQQTKELATCEDNSRIWADLLLISSSVASLAGAGAALLEANHSRPTLKLLLTVAGVLTVALSWGLVHTVFTLRYAHEYYTPPAGGIDFKMDQYEPDYGDFAYVAFTIGMTFQVSDTDIASREIRRTVLRHALLAYLFGAVILALVVNVVATLLNR